MKRLRPRTLLTAYATNANFNGSYPFLLLAPTERRKTQASSQT